MSINIDRLRKLVYFTLIQPMDEYKLLNDYLAEQFNRWLANKKYSGDKIQITIEDIYKFTPLAQIDDYESELLEIVK